MKIAIVMATYKGQELVEEQFQSLFRQSQLPDEIVVRDDCSPDKTMEKLEQIRKESPVPVTIHSGKTNLGYIRNFTEALKTAQADIYFYCDQDDVWFPNKIEKHLGIYKASPATLAIISNQEIVGPDLTPSGRTSLAEITNIRRTDHDFVHGCCTSFRHGLYPAAIAPPKYFAHDDWIHALASACGRRIVIEQPLQLFRRHDRTTTSSQFNSVGGRVSRKFSSKMEVMANLHKRAEMSFATANALKDLVFPNSDNTVGVEDSLQQAQAMTIRANELERGIPALPSMIRGVCNGRRSVREFLVDSVRILGVRS